MQADPSKPERYAPIFVSDRTGFAYDDGASFDSCADVAELMLPPKDGYGRQAGVAFRLANGQLVLARPGGRSMRLARAA